MSVFKSKKSSPYYWYDFQISGRRFHGSTRSTNRREAEKIEAQERERAQALVKAARHAAVSLQIDHVADRYWNERGQYHSGSDNTARDLARLVEHFGKTKLLTDISDADVAKLVATRRSDRVIRSPKANISKAPLVSNATVNRTTTGALRTLFAFAKSEGVRFDHEPNWLRHMLAKTEERLRELHDDEAERIDAAMRADYEPFFAFVRATGMRQKECVTLRWSEINWGAKQIVKLGKGGRRITFPITAAIRAIIWPLQGHHPEFVFTYAATRTRDGRVQGKRYQLTISGVKTRWRRMRKQAGVSDFRFHDFRHDFATKLLRQSRNLKLTQRALNHADIRTTLKYAHVLDEEIATAVEDLAQSRENPRGLVRKVK
jgi:integrase